MCLLLTAFYNSLFIDTINKLCHTLQGVENMNELQRKERDLLKIFVDFCNKHNLKYRVYPSLVICVCTYVTL